LPIKGIVGSPGWFKAHPSLPQTAISNKFATYRNGGRAVAQNWDMTEHRTPTAEASAKNK